MVITIIALLSAIAVPAIKNISRVDSMSAATRRLLDDVSYARRQAILNRTTVYMVFLPNNYHALGGAFTGTDRDLATSLLDKQYVGYALFTFRRVGEQPGQQSPEYLRDWRSLPRGVFIPTWKFTSGMGFVKAFRTVPIPFPEAISAAQLPLPYLAFNYQGQLVYFDSQGKPVDVKEDAIIPLAQGAAIFPTDPATKEPLWQAPQVIETPPNNSVNNYHHVRIDWLTGRAKIVRREVTQVQ